MGKEGLFQRMMGLLVCAILLAGVPIQVLAKLPPLIPREFLLGDPEKVSPQISPDGTRLAYLAPKDDVLNIWVRTIGKHDDTVVTQEKERGIWWYFWAEDNNHIIYYQDFYGDGNYHLYAVDLSNEVTRDLTPFLGVGVGFVETDPNFPNQMLVSLNLLDRSIFDVYRLDLNTGALVKDTENPSDIVGWFTDSNFQIRGATALTPDGGFELRIRDDINSPWRPLVHWEPEDTHSSAIGFTPDGKGMYLRDNRNANTLQLRVIDIATGEYAVLAADPEYDIGSVITHPRTHKVQAVSFVRDRTYWQVIDPSIEKDIQAIKKVHHGYFSLLSRDGADKNWLIEFITDDGPTPYYVYNRETHTATFLFTYRSELEQYTFAPMKPITLKARDGLTLHGYLTLPVGVKAKNLPMVLLVGGQWSRDVWGFNPHAQLYANRGYACLQVNFRGVAGYGKKFANAGNREWGGKMQDDLIDAVNWAIKEGIADSNRIAIVGSSYGGYAALVGAAFTPDVFACAIDAFGPSNLVSFLKSIPPYWKREIWYQRIGNVDTEEEFLKSRSPLFKVDQIKIPLLIAHGANDPRVKQSESDQIVEALRKRGKSVEYILFEDEGHGFFKLENRLKFTAALESFLAKHLGGRVEQ